MSDRAKYFDYSLTILSQELEKLEQLRVKYICYPVETAIKELKYVIEILNKGQGYLTDKEPVKIKFFKDEKFI